jgi:hypothetical protein
MTAADRKTIFDCQCERQLPAKTRKFEVLE